MDFLYVPTQYSTEAYSSFVDSETANNLPGLSHSSDASSRGSTPKSFDHGWEMDAGAANSVADGTFWAPQPSYDAQIEIGMSVPHPAYQHNLDPFGGRAGPQYSGDSLQGSSFDSLLKGLEHQSYVDAFSYTPAYEPLNWSLPQQSSANTWTDSSSSASFPIAAPRPVRAASNDVFRSLDVYTFPAGVSQGQLAVGSSSGAPISKHVSSIRYNPLAVRRDAPKNTVARPRSGSESATHQHQCSACLCRFARARDLTRHFRLHTGERPYECTGCGERFIRVDARKRHWNGRPSCKAAHDRLVL